jgi:glutathione S-transferase
MACLRIFSYLPNPRLYKATIAARFSGAEIEILGAKPQELPDWLWDYDARPLREGDRESPEIAASARTAKRGFQGTLFKTDRFLEANPFGDVPAAFGDDGRVGLFESNSIMRAAARLGPEAETICGRGPLETSRVDAFLDRTLLFARDIQPYLLSARGDGLPEHIHQTMKESLESYCGGIDRALGQTAHVAADTLSLADIAFACEICLLSNELLMEKALSEAGLAPLLPNVREYPRVWEHLGRLAEHPHFSADLSDYFERMGLRGSK